MEQKPTTLTASYFSNSCTRVLWARLLNLLTFSDDSTNVRRSGVDILILSQVNYAELFFRRKHLRLCLCKSLGVRLWRN